MRFFGDRIAAPDHLSRQAVHGHHVATKRAAGIIRISATQFLVGCQTNIKAVAIKLRRSCDPRRGMRVNLNLPDGLSVFRVDCIQVRFTVSEIREVTMLDGLTHSD